MGDESTMVIADGAELFEDEPVVVTVAAPHYADDPMMKTGGPRDAQKHSQKEEGEDQPSR